MVAFDHNLGANRFESSSDAVRLVKHKRSTEQNLSLEAAFHQDLPKVSRGSRRKSWGLGGPQKAPIVGSREGKRGGKYYRGQS